MQRDNNQNGSYFDPELDDDAIEALFAELPLEPLPDRFVERTMTLIRQEELSHRPQSHPQPVSFRLSWVDLVYPFGLATLGTTSLLTFQWVLTNDQGEIPFWVSLFDAALPPQSIVTLLSGAVGCGLILYFYLNQWIKIKR